MQISVQIAVQTDVDEQPSVTEITHFEREGFDADSLGLHPDEAKALLGQLQRSMIDAQAAEAISRLSSTAIRSPFKPRCSINAASDRPLPAVSWRFRRDDVSARAFR